MSAPKIALVGPALPYRSGIAIHTSKMHEALQSAGIDTDIFSFKRQYPQWLYPGKDTPPDVAKDGVSKTNYQIDVYDPLSWQKTADAIISDGYTVAILTWWTVFWQPGFFVIERRLRQHGVKTIYFCHNLFDHKTGGIMGLANQVLGRLSRSILRQADAYIVQSTDQEKQLLELKPQAQIMRRMHPIAADPELAKTILPKRGRLELLFFGLIRPYKGLDTLLASATWLNDKEVYLTIVGEPWGDVEDIKQQLAQSTIPNLETHLEYVDDQQAAQYFERADAVILPYKAATGSAVVALAYAYGKPVLATKVTGLVDAVIDGKTGWLIAPESPEALAEAIQSTDRQKAESMRADIMLYCKDNSWQVMATKITDFAKKLTS